MEKARTEMELMLFGRRMKLEKTYTARTTTDEIKIRDLKYKYSKIIIPTNQFLNKCRLVTSSLRDF